jgi:hypothetical protein
MGNLVGSVETRLGLWVLAPIRFTLCVSFAKIEMVEDQGWSWRELMNFNGVGAEQKVQLEALALLMSILQHPDNKPANQRLVCLKDGVLSVC